MRFSLWINVIARRPQADEAIYSFYLRLLCRHLARLALTLYFRVDSLHV